MAQETIIRPAGDVETIAAQLIPEYHPELTEAVILYLFTSGAASCEPQKCNPKLRYAFSTHVQGIIKAEVAAGPDFLVWVNEDEWAFLVPGQHRPFVDHRLSHCSMEKTAEGTPRWILQGHPIEEFPETLQRFGAWNDGLKQVRGILQPEFDFTATEDADTRMTLHVPGHAPVTVTTEQFQQATDAIRRGSGQEG